jgi:hypothetical protein
MAASLIPYHTIVSCQVIGNVSRENIFVNKDGIHMLPTRNETGSPKHQQRDLFADGAGERNRSSLVLAQVGWGEGRVCLYTPPSRKHIHTP